MPYELVDPLRRVCQPNEYFNTETQEFEVIRRHGLYDVQETFLVPGGRVLLLAYSPAAAQAYAIGIYQSDQVEYWSAPIVGRRYFARRIAESHGLTVGPANCHLIANVDRISLARKADEVQTIADSIAESGDLSESDEELRAAVNTLRNHMEASGIRLWNGE
ncbi:hypothetical protein AB0P17_29625 [Streptomyces sp. NPDC088124]|uniref:hypothetical protein n=1 Tax=Streptomyces sp. NPDC088124 TaxID=3154654 RepID=UPI0034475637